jgi:hypothetical protein
MSNLLHLQARLDAPIACDMSAAPDTPDERLAEYGELFERALLRRDRPPDGIVFGFRADPGTREQVDDLARREHACCPFLDYRIETVGDEIVWTTTWPGSSVERGSVDAILDAMHALPDHAGEGMSGLLDKLAERGLTIVEAESERFELR